MAKVVSSETSRSAGPNLPETDEEQIDSGNGIRALATGLEVLKIIAQHRRPLPLREIAAATNMSPSRVHRYLTSLVAERFIEQDQASGRYGLGQSVIELGLSALGQLDSVRIGVEALNSFSDVSELDGHLSVWGTFGPTVVRWRSGLHGSQHKIDEGRVLPLLWSATGRVLMAHRPENDYRQLVAREIDEWNRWHPESRIGPHDVSQMLEKVRAHGMAETRPTATMDQLMEPVFPRLFAMFQFSGLAVPVFDNQARVVMAITFFANDAQRVIDGGSLEERLKALAHETSRRLGASDPEPPALD